MNISALLHVSLAMALAPLLIGTVNRTKAVIAGRSGAPLFQVYYDLYKLLRKSAVYSTTTTWIFRAGPIIGLSVTILALTLLPQLGSGALFSFGGDFVLFAYLLGLGRFFTVVAAMDTGSAFEGMGASREAAFSAIAEPVMFIIFLALVRFSSAFSLSEFAPSLASGSMDRSIPALALMAASLFMLMLAENSRIPIDDPNTHLELTMIHEVMVLDHSGPDLAFIIYGSALKFWVFAALIAGLVLPVFGQGGVMGMLAYIASIFILGLFVGLVESGMARLRMFRVPQFLAVATAFAASALILSLL